ncbi:anaphase-promoting complex subunit 7 [Onthophagus taurus]|uniref:anaphase-promoting complex subunit 7 n=1 Tax=Onthophagus taurus TaxID=166361 RepID=UPI0039BDD577
MCVALKYIVDMFEKELYSNVIKTIDMALLSSDQKLESTPITKLQVYLYYGDSHYQLQQYLQAEEAYTQALQLRMFLMKSKSNGKLNESHQEIPNDVDIKYKMHLCYVYLKKTKKSLEILQSIPNKSRDAKINMALGNLYRDGGCEKSAISYYKEVLKENPYAIEVAENLLKLGVKGTDVNSLMLEVTSEPSWLNLWLRGQAQMYSQDYNSAIATFKSLEIQNLLKDNSSLLVTIAYCYVYLCDNKSALQYLQRAIRSDPNMRYGRDLYASLLARSTEKEHLQELERLVNNVDLNVNLWTAEYWVVMGYCIFVHKKFVRACNFGQKACSLNSRCVEALLLKAYTLFEVNKLSEALTHFKEAKTIAPTRLEPYKGIIDCYLGLSRPRDAVNVAIHACRELKNSPQSLTLYAKILQKNPNMTSMRVRDLLDKALNKDPTYHPAVWLLAEHLEQEQRHEEACSVLTAHVAEYPSSRTHQMLADCFLRLSKEDEAVSHYSAAIRLDPCNQRALDGLNSIGRGGKLDANYYMSVGGESSYTPSQGPSVPSDQDLDGESEPDLWANNGDFMNYD